MSAHRPYGVDRDTAERLLNGESVDPGDRLVRFLSAVRAPAQSGELAGEEAAVNAFRSAHHGPSRQPRRRSMLKIALAKLLTLKVAGATAVAAAATGGVAMAAASGTLSNPLAGGDTAKVQPSPHGTGKPADAGKDGKVSPSPSLEGLCRAYTAGVADNAGKALENPAFRVLITTAGGKDRVAAYCDDLLADMHKRPAPTGGAADKPGETRPTGKPDSPDHKPTSQPGGNRPANQPTAPPTA